MYQGQIDPIRFDMSVVVSPAISPFLNLASASLYVVTRVWLVYVLCMPVCDCKLWSGQPWDLLWCFWFCDQSLCDILRNMISWELYQDLAMSGDSGVFIENKALPNEWQILMVRGLRHMMGVSIPLPCLQKSHSKTHTHLSLRLLSILLHSSQIIVTALKTSINQPFPFCAKPVEPFVSA